jgi:transposase
VASNILGEDATNLGVKRKQLDLAPEQREDLEALVARPKAPAGHVRRARIILLSADGVLGSEIATRVGMSQEQVSRIRTRFLEGGVEALADRPKAGRKDHAVSAEVEHRILELALSPPPPGRSRWTTRLIGREVKLTSWTVSKILRRHDVKPHLLRTYKVSRDPAFAEKVRDVVGLYLNPPQNAVVLSVDEKTQVQALERTQLPLPLRVGRAVRHTHDYKRHGVVDLYAALNVESGEVAHACTESHTGADFLAFMKMVARGHRNVELHVILDNSSTHSTPEVKAWLAKHPRIHFHYTPTSASWLNQVEGFFGILSKQSLSLTNFPSKKALREHIEKYIAGWNEHPTPFIWTKPADAIIKSHRKMSERISHAVH